MVKKLTHQLRSASINSLTITIKSQSNIYFATLAFLSSNLINYFKYLSASLSVRLYRTLIF